MHIIKPMAFSVMLAAVTASAIAQAGPAVNGTFKNNGTAAAIYSAVGKNGAGTKAIRSRREVSTVIKCKAIFRRM